MILYVRLGYIMEYQMSVIRFRGLVISYVIPGCTIAYKLDDGKYYTPRMILYYTYFSETRLHVASEQQRGITGRIYIGGLEN
jgi:hypothetical protein